MLQSIYTLIGFLVFWCLCFLVALVVAAIVYRWFIDKIWNSDWFSYYVKRKRFDTDKMRAAYDVFFAPFKPGIRRGSAWRYSVKLRAKNIRDAAPKYVHVHPFDKRILLLLGSIQAGKQLINNGAAIFYFSDDRQTLYTCDISGDKITNYHFLPVHLYTDEKGRLYKCRIVGTLYYDFFNNVEMHERFNDLYKDVTFDGITFNGLSEDPIPYNRIRMHNE